MNNSVDYQMEVHLKNLEDELKSAEQQYLDKIECIVSKYTAKATEHRERSLKQYEAELNNYDASIVKKEANSMTMSKETQTPSKPKRNKTQRMVKNIKNLDRFTKNEEIEINPKKESGYTPNHIQKIRESLKRGKLLYENKKNQQPKIANISIIKKPVQIQKNEEKENENYVNDDDDDDLDIIPLNSWSKKIGKSTDSNNFNKLDESYDSNCVQIHHGESCDHSIASTLSSVSSLRNSYVLSNTLKYGKNEKFKKRLMVNRMRRKRKYQSELQENDDGMNYKQNPYEPPIKKSNIKSIKSIDLMSSRDLKNEIRRINKSKAKTISNRKNLLLTKSMPNFAAFIASKNKNIPNPFNSNTESETDDDLFTSKIKKRTR